MANPLSQMITRDIGGSTAIERIGYNIVSQELFIKFKHREKYPTYIFGGIQRDLVEQFFMARSHGSFYHNHFKSSTSYRVDRAMGSFRLGAVGRRLRNFISRK